nr:ABC transporter permease [Aneurinibacillus sp. XH2]
MNLWPLIQNENMKIYKRIRTWIFIGLLVGVAIAVSFLPSADKNDEWWKQLNEANSSLTTMLEDPSLSDFDKQRLRNEIAINEYRLNYNLPPDDSTLWGTVRDYTLFISFITLFTVIIASDSVAREYSWGTMKLLLIRPVSRSRILLAKYLSVLMFAVFLLILLFVVSVLAGGFKFGIHKALSPYLYVVNGEVKEGSILLHLLQIYGLKSVHLLMIVTFAFTISTLFKNGTLAVACAIVLMFTGNALVLFFSGYSWVKYLLFTHTNLLPYLEGSAPMEGLTPGFSILMLALYYLLFIALSWIVFSRRDVRS